MPLCYKTKNLVEKHQVLTKNKNLAIANRWRVSGQLRPQYVEGIYRSNYL